MKQVQILSFDDLDWTISEIRTEATETVRLALDDEIVELDLTEAHAKELRELARPYLDAGSPPDSEPRKAARPNAGGGSGVPHVNGQPPEDRQERWRYNEAMRAYADARGIDYRANRDSTPYYSAALRAEFAAYLRGGGR